MSDLKEEKSEDKKDIEMEEREKMLNAENKAQEIESSEDKQEEKKTPKDIKEGMEVKPKKIPIGGIQMPGFFTRSKSKERCKDDTDATTEGVELIEKSADANPENNAQTKIKLPNPFRKSKAEDDGDKPAEPKEKKKLLDTIRLPLVSVFPRKKKDDSLESQTAQAGLASMETLDDKSTDGKTNDDNNMKTVSLDDKTDLEKQQQSESTSFFGKMKSHKAVIGALLLFVLVIIIIIIFSIPRSGNKNSPPVRDGKFVVTLTGCGRVEGLIEDSSVAFRGIPYARPPIDDLRFKYAQPLNNLDYCWNGTFLAHNATDLCLQILSNGTVMGAEDCLTLDVVTPYVRYDNPLPVIVLIGAESLMGGSPGKMRPSARYARSRDVVFVRPNFRLGALGFLALKALSESDYPKTSGNYGLSDILAALKWVQLNIEHFGGDKKAVTIFGHRAGATLVTALSTIPDAKKYFARAWASSGGAIYPKKPVAESEMENQSFMEAVQCEDVECLRSLDAEKLVSAVEDTWRKPQPDLPTVDEVPEKRHEWLVLDGRILKEHPDEVWSREEELPVKLIVGTTAQAGSTEKLLLKHTEWTEPLVKEHINQSFLSKNNLSDDALKMYPATYRGLSTMISDIRIACPLFSICSRVHKIPFYIVTQTRWQHDIADIDSDVDAILGRYEPKTPEQRRYFSAMQGLFYDYVWKGKIEQEMIGQKVLVVGQDVLLNSTYSHCAFWMVKNIVPTYAALD
ncbi:neurotactin-like [Leptinotarsa decemlineata]|uniref:neurotactin-like n=1 Tax=Leptinotarsa decemlineata TaxID=7539 RepID=UPI003D30C8BD